MYHLWRSTHTHKNVFNDWELDNTNTEVTGLDTANAQTLRQNKCMKCEIYRWKSLQHMLKAEIAEIFVFEWRLIFGFAVSIVSWREYINLLFFFLEQIVVFFFIFFSSCNFSSFIKFRMCGFWFLDRCDNSSLWIHWIIYYKTPVCVSSFMSCLFRGWNIFLSGDIHRWWSLALFCIKKNYCFSIMKQRSPQSLWLINISLYYVSPPHFLTKVQKNKTKNIRIPWVFFYCWRGLCQTYIKLNASEVGWVTELTLERKMPMTEWLKP